MKRSKGSHKLQPGDRVVMVETVWSTAYNALRPNKVNRRVDESSEKFRNLLALMTQEGYLQAYPIVCAMEDGVLTIQKGHNRKRAAEILNIEFCYTVTDKIVPIWDLENAGPGTWDNKAFWESAVKRGVKSVVEIMQFMNKTGIPRSDACEMFHGGIAGGKSFHTSKALRGCEFNIIDRVHPRQVGDIIIYLRDVIGISWAARSNMVGAISRLCKLPEFRVDQFKAKAQTHRQLLVQQQSMKDYLVMIEALYNFNTSRKTKRLNLAFLVEDAARARKINNLNSTSGTKSTQGTLPFN